MLEVPLSAEAFNGLRVDDEVHAVGGSFDWWRATSSPRHFNTSGGLLTCPEEAMVVDLEQLVAFGVTPKRMRAVYCPKVNEGLVDPHCSLIPGLKMGEAIICKCKK